MATSNIAITKTWTKVAEDTDDPVLLTFRLAGSLEVATTSTDVAPTVRGHRVSHGDSVTRLVLGDGFMWARCAPDGPIANAVVEVSK